MKLAALALALALTGCAGLKPEVYGLHVASHHEPDSGSNNFNPGVYVRTENGFTAGAYKNSIKKESVYVGYTTPEWMRFRLSAGVISGYRQDPVPFIIPTVRLFTVAGWDTRVALIPRFEEKGQDVLHLMIERKF